MPARSPRRHRCSGCDRGGPSPYTPALESAGTPEWSPGGLLHYITDASGWWNVTSWRHGAPVLLVGESPESVFPEELPADEVLPPSEEEERKRLPQPKPKPFPLPGATMQPPPEPEGAN